VPQRSRGGKYFLGEGTKGRSLGISKVFWQNFSVVLPFQDSFAETTGSFWFFKGILIKLPSCFDVSKVFWQNFSEV